MANPPRSLASRLSDWPTVLRFLGVSLPQLRLLPACIACPLCARGELRLVDDHVLEGTWADCPTCRFAGDLIELTAAVRRGDTRQAVRELQQEGLFSTSVTEQDLDTYTAEHLDYRARLQAFWDVVRRRPLREMSEEGFDLLTALGVRDSQLRFDWLDRLGRLVGVTTPQAAEELFAPGSYRSTARLNPNGSRTLRRGGGPGRRRILQATTAGELAVLPYYDVPGRICGFLFLGRNPHSGQPDLVYRRANFGSNRRAADPGWAWLPVLDEPNPVDVRRRVLVLTDPVLAIRLQARHLLESPHLLPILVPFLGVDFETRQFPPMAWGRRVICWGTEPQLYRFARPSQGCISRLTITRTELFRQGLSRYTGSEWLARFDSAAVPWQAHLVDRMLTLDSLDAYRILKVLDLPGPELEALIQPLPEAVRRELRFAGSGVGRGSAVTCRRKRIEELVEGWTLSESEEQLCNFCPRVEELLKPSQGEPFCRIALHMEGDLLQGEAKTLRFVVPWHRVQQRGLFREAVDESVQHAIEPPLWYRRGWNRDSLSIAMQFSSPVTRPAADRMGWHPATSEFVFPRFAVTAEGKFRSEPAPLDGLEPLPARHLSAPLDLGRQAVLRLSEQRLEVAVLWAVTACVATNLLVGPFFHSPWGLVLDGPAAQEMGIAAATALGCAELDLRRGRSRAPLLEAIQEHAPRHGWPLVVHLPPQSRRRPTAQWLDEPAVRNCVLPLDPLAAAVTASASEFVRLTVPGPALPLGPLRPAAEPLIPFYLADLYQRRFNLAAPHGTIVEMVLADLAVWLERMGGEAQAVFAARSLLHCDHLEAWRSFLLVTERLLNAGDLTWSTSAADDPPGADVRFGVPTASGPAMLIRAERVNAELARRRLPGLSLVAVRRALQTAGGWLEPTPTSAADVWAIAASWLHGHWTGRLQP